MQIKISITTSFCEYKAKYVFCNLAWAYSLLAYVERVHKVETNALSKNAWEAVPEHVDAHWCTSRKRARRSIFGPGDRDLCYIKAHSSHSARVCTVSDQTLVTVLRLQRAKQ